MRNLTNARFFFFQKRVRDWGFEGLKVQKRWKWGAGAFGTAHGDALLTWCPTTVWTCWHHFCYIGRNRGSPWKHFGIKLPPLSGQFKNKGQLAVWAHRCTAAPPPSTTQTSIDRTSMVPWYRGTMVPWYHGTMVPRYHGGMVPWYHGTMVPRCKGTVVPWYRGTIVQRYHGTIHRTMVPWYHGTMVDFRSNIKSFAQQLRITLWTKTFITWRSWLSFEHSLNGSLFFMARLIR